jgi:FkbM family methyltransferase
MDVRHYEIVKPKRLAPEVNGWKQAWYGYYRLEEATSHEIEATSQERPLEVDCLLSIVEDVNKRGQQYINLIELGAGWGETCMVLAGIIDFKLIPHNIKSYSYLAVEAEPYYCQLIEKHFITNDLPLKILHVAISDRIGLCRFNQFTSSSTYFGQGMTFGGNVGGSRLKTMALAGYHILRGKTVKVPMITVDSLLDNYYPHVDIIQADVQGVEDKVIKGAMESIKQGKIDYWLIGTHHKKLNEKCRRMLEPWYDCVVDIMPSKEKRMGFNQDGTQLFRRKGL